MNWHVGDRVYLVPALPTAPTVAYRQPVCRIVALSGVRVEVELDGGHRLWTSIRNLAVRPLEPEPVKTKPVPARRLVLADDEQEVTLW